jgi:hypothetical protein
MNFRYVLESEHMKKFFDYIQLPNFDIASDASLTFKVRCTNKLFEKCSLHCDLAHVGTISYVLVPVKFSVTWLSNIEWLLFVIY